MFWNRKHYKDEPTARTSNYRLDSETANYGMFVYQPGAPVSIYDLQAMRDQGWRPLFVEEIRSADTPHCIVCERIEP